MSEQSRERQMEQLPEIARLLMRLNHVARFIVNANHSTMRLVSGWLQLLVKESVVIGRDGERYARCY